MTKIVTYSVLLRVPKLCFHLSNETQNKLYLNRLHVLKNIASLPTFLFSDYNIDVPPKLHNGKMPKKVLSPQNGVTDIA